MPELTSANSPLARVARRGGLRAAGRSTTGRRRLSARDEADLKLVLEGKYEYTDAEVFHLPQEQAMREVFDDAPPIEKPDTSWYHPVMDSVEAMRRQSKNTGSVLLTAKEERALFLQFNYCRYRVCLIREELLDRPNLDLELAEEMLRWYRKAEAYRDQIAQTNLALVLAMAKRTRMSEVDFADLVSEGNMALLRATDKFDAGRGFKFSTYACRAILKAFSRAGMKLSKYRSIFPTGFDPEFERSDYMETKRAGHEGDCAEEVRRIVETNQAELSHIEQQVIKHRFQLVAPDVLNEPKPPITRNDGKPLTLQQVGQIIGVTKERVRQIQNRAMEKIRGEIEGDFLR
ncbi:MAG: sigma-70 family RNA polymerase sigma factor [Planctomycetota bacterium]